MTISIAQIFLNSNFVNKYLLPIGDITYTIYLMSFFGQYASKVLVVNLLHLHWSVCVLSMFVSGLVFPLAVYYIFNKMPMLHKSNIIKYCLGL